MTVSSVSRSSGSGTVHLHHNPSHRHTKSSSAIGSIALPVQHAPSPAKVQLHHHAAHQPQSPTANKFEPLALKKKRRQRKPKDLSKSIIAQTSRSTTATATTATLHDSPPPAAAAAAAPMPPPSRARSAPEQLKTPTKPQASSSALDSPGKAYAGPGFHHSPAPSSLPVPKFFSRSVPVRGSSPGLRALLGDDADSTDGSQSSSSSSPPPPSPPFLSMAAETPLEKLFKADREEKARKHRGDSSDSDSMTDRGIFDMDPGSPVRPAPANTATPPRTHPAIQDSIFNMDSTASLPATPVRSAPRPKGESDRQATGAALRQFLLQQPGVLQAPTLPSSSSSNPSSPSPAAGRAHTFVGPQGSPLARRPLATGPNLGRPPLLPLHPHHRHHHPLLPFPPPKAPQFRPAPHQHSPSRPSGVENTPPFSSSRRDSPKACKAESHDVVHMENSLRQILKLDPRPTLAGGVLI